MGTICARISCEKDMLQFPGGAAGPKHNIAAEGKKGNAIQLHCLVLPSAASQHTCHSHASAAGVSTAVHYCYKQYSIQELDISGH